MEREGALTRRPQELGCLRSLRGSITSDLPFLLSPNLVSRGAPLICQFQHPWFVLPDKQGPSSCQVSLSQSLCK